MSLLANLAFGRPSNIEASTLGRDALAGTISAIVNIAYCISFSALIFQGSIAAGFPLGLAALIMGTVVTGVVVALTTTLVPADAGPDTPAVAVMSVLAATVAAGLASRGASEEAMIINVLVAISVSTFLTGVLLFGVGALKLGQWLRCVPYPVIGGFLAASGWLLITGGVEVITGSNLTISPKSWVSMWDARYALQIGVGLAFALFIVLLKRWMDDFLTLPVAFFAFLVVMNAVLFGLVPDQETRSAWFLEAVGALQNNKEISGAIIDLDSKEVDGVNLIADLRAQESTQHLTVIVHTIQSSKELVDKMMEYGVIGYLLKPYVEKEIYPVDPFQRIDQSGVGELMKLAVSKGRSVRPDLKIGICGEHGGEPNSVKFCHRIGLNYVSCSPYRVPVARLAAAQAALEDK